MVKVRNWCALAMALVRGGEARVQPIFQPVREKILPADPIFTQRSAMPGRVQRGVNGGSPNTISSHTSSQIAIRSWRRQASARTCSWSRS